MIELYEFDTGAEVFRFTSTVKPLNTIRGLFQPASVLRGELTISENPLKSRLTFSLAITNAFAVKCLKDEYPDTIIVRVFREDNLYWYGKVISASLKRLTIELICEPSLGVNTTGLGGARFSPYCWKGLYSTACGVSRIANTFTYTSYTLSGRTITVSTATVDGFFANGIAQIADEQRLIVSSTGSSIELSERFSNTVSGNLKLSRGCFLTRESCLSFSNLDNFGGFSYIPSKNINTGQSILN